MLTTIIRSTSIFRTLITFQIDQILLPRIRCASFWLWWLAPIRSWRMSYYPKEQRLLMALIELGPIFVKFGQSLSTRVDLLDKPMADALATLQDRVPAFSTDKAIDIIENHLHSPLEKKFSFFNNTPLGSASIAQVHAACLHSGEDVVVKILRPNIHRDIDRDLKVLGGLATLIELFHPKRKQLRAHDIIEDYANTITHELNLTLEASNMRVMQQAFEEDARIHIPKIFWEYCTDKILVTERVYGIPITQIDTLEKQGTNMEKLARNGVELFLEQVFNHNFFHADMHPGNIFVDISDPEDPVYQLVDFGIVGILPKRDQIYLAENLAAFFSRDYQKVAELHIESGWVDRKTHARSMGADIRAIGEPIYGKPLNKISFAHILMQLFRVAEKHHMYVQPQLLLLQKTLFHVEGLARRIDDNMQLPDIAEPIIQKWLQSKKGILSSSYKIIEKIPEWLSLYPEVKDAIIHKILDTHKSPPAKEKIQSNIRIGTSTLIVLLTGLLIGWSGILGVPQL